MISATPKLPRCPWGIDFTKCKKRRHEQLALWRMDILICGRYDRFAWWIQGPIDRGEGDE